MKEYLENYYKYKARIKKLRIDLKKELNKEAKVSGSNFEINGDIRPTGYMSNNIENQIISKTDKIKEIEDEIEELEDIIELVDEALKMLSYKERQVVEMAVMQDKDHSIVASALGYEQVNSITRIISGAIQKMEEIMK